MGMKLRKKETNDSTLHVEFRGGKKDFLLLFFFALRQRLEA